MVVLTFTVLAFVYGVFLLKNNFRFVSLFFLSMYSVSFLLPALINKKFNYKFYLSDIYYEKLNVLYLSGLIIFILSNFIFNFTKIKNVKFGFLKVNVLTKKSINKLFLVFLVLFAIMAIVLGIEVVLYGTTATLELPSIIKIFQSITILGAVYSSLLKIYFSESKREIIFGVFISILVILFSSLFLFGRRLLLYPIIAVIALFIFKRKKSPSLIKLSVIAITTITIILPGMMSIRTLGFSEGIKNFRDILFGDYNQYLQYLSVGTDVTYSYSLAGIIMAYDTRITPLTLLKPIFSFIPRSIYPDKPQPLSEAIVEHLSLDFDQGMSIPPGIVGESLLYGGIIWMIFVFLIFGVVCGLLDNYTNYLRAEKNGLFSTNLIFITIVTVQFLSGSIRGDTATNIQESFYLFLPFLFLLIASKYKFVLSK